MSIKDNGREKKAFDSTVCFTFYGSWVEAITDLETDVDKDSAAYQLFKAIADYSMYNEEPDFDTGKKSLKAIWHVISNEIDNSLKRRKQGFADEGPNKKQVAVIDVCVNHPTATNREIANMLGLSKDFVWRTKRKYVGIITERLKTQQTDDFKSVTAGVSSTDACYSVPESDSGDADDGGSDVGDDSDDVVTDSVIYNGHDSIATRQVRQLRQDSNQFKDIEDDLPF